MLVILQFIFSSFWIWLGSMFLITAVGNAAGQIIRSFIPIRKYYVTYGSLDEAKRREFNIEYLKKVNDANN